MAVLDDTARTQIWRGLMRYLSGLRESIALNKVELRAAIDATDTWINDNQASFNTALPAAAQSNLTTVQKTLLFCVVAARRVSPAFTRRLLGEIN